MSLGNKIGFGCSLQLTIHVHLQPTVTASVAYAILLTNNVNTRISTKATHEKQKKKIKCLAATYKPNAATVMAVLLQLYLLQAENGLSIDNDDRY